MHDPYHAGDWSVGAMSVTQIPSKFEIAVIVIGLLMCGFFVGYQIHTQPTIIKETVIHDDNGAKIYCNGLIYEVHKENTTVYRDPDTQKIIDWMIK